MILPLAATLLATGLFAGFLAGLLGVGGGIVLVAVLFHVFTEFGIDEAVRMHLAVGTSLSTIIFTAWRSVGAHRARGAVDDALLRAWVVPILLGVVLGSALARVLAGPALMTVFAVVALLVAFHMAFGREEWRLADLPPAGAARHVLGATIGMLSVLMGLGGGALGVPTFTLLGVPIRRAVGTAAGLGLLIAIPGTLGFVLAGLGVPGRPPFSLGYVNGVGFALIVPATMLAAPWGARVAHAVPRTALRRAFAIFLAITSVRMLLELH
ncbi:MAG TPA: sulfite exporter TauE/SafE family protein [Myxococcota bacterium]